MCPSEKPYENQKSTGLFSESVYICKNVGNNFLFSNHICIVIIEVNVLIKLSQECPYNFIPMSIMTTPTHLLFQW
jgi:hypothetical protein